MKEYDVTITETLQRTVSVQAESREEAEQIVEDAWNKEEYVLDAEDFVGADFEADEGRETSKEREADIKIVRVRCHKNASIETIPNALRPMQELVGGYIEAVTLEKGAVLICNEEGKFNGMEPNRALGDRKSAQWHKVDEVIYGDFFIIGADDKGEFKSLSPELAEKYETEFRFPEKIVNARDGAYSALYLPQREAEYER